MDSVHSFSTYSVPASCTMQEAGDARAYKTRTSLGKLSQMGDKSIIMMHNNELSAVLELPAEKPTRVLDRR